MARTVPTENLNDPGYAAKLVAHFAAGIRKLGFEVALHDIRPVSVGGADRSKAFSLRLKITPQEGVNPDYSKLEEYLTKQAESQGLHISIMEEIGRPDLVNPSALMEDTAKFRRGLEEKQDRRSFLKKLGLGAGAAIGTGALSGADGFRREAKNPRQKDKIAETEITAGSIAISGGITLLIALPYINSPLPDLPEDMVKFREDLEKAFQQFKQNPRGGISP